MNKIVRFQNKLNYFKNKFLIFYLNKFIWNKDKYEIDLLKLFKNLEHLKYIIIKIDTPYTPENFPVEYPIGKDMDIFCVKEDFRKINKVLLNFANRHKTIFEIKIIDKNSKYRVRLEKYGQLYYMLDNNCLTDNNLPAIFIEEAVNNRIKKNTYFTAKIKYEVIFRLSEVLNNPDKKYHVEYIKKYKNNIDVGLIPSEELKQLYYSVVENEC